MNSIKSISAARENELKRAQKRAMMTEIKRQCAEYYRKHENEFVALILWEIHEQLHKDVDELRTFWENFNPTLKDLIDYYELSEDDQYWLCNEKLKRIGVDIEAWQAEKEEE